MTMKTLGAAILTIGSLIAYTGPAAADTPRDCVLEGTVRDRTLGGDRSAASDRMYVAFESYRPAEEGANCTIRRREKLQFKQPSTTDLQSMRPGTRVEYRYTEDPDSNARWELREVKKSS